MTKSVAMKETNMRMSGLITWLAAACVTISLTAAEAEASPITVSYNFFAGSTSVASGSFTFDSALDGSVLDYGDLSAFTFTFAGSGASYDLAFVNSGGFTTLNFAFDTATDSFVFGLSGSPLAAVKPGQFGLTLGFNVQQSSIIEYILGVQSSHGWNTVTTTRSPTAAPVPEPGTLLLLGFGLAGLAARRRLKKAAQTAAGTQSSRRRTSESE